MKESLLAQVAGKISPYRDRKSTYLGWKKGSLFSFSKLTLNTKQKGSKPSFSHQHITLLHFPAREQERHTSCRLWPVARTKQRGCFHCPGWEGEGVLNSRAVKGKSTLKLISGPLTYLITYTGFFFLTLQFLILLSFTSVSLCWFQRSLSQLSLVWDQAWGCISNLTFLHKAAKYLGLSACSYCAINANISINVLKLAFQELKMQGLLSFKCNKWYHMVPGSPEHLPFVCWRCLWPERDLAGGVWELARELRSPPHVFHGAHWRGPPGAPGRCDVRIPQQGHSGIRNRYKEEAWSEITYISPNGDFYFLFLFFKFCFSFPLHTTSVINQLLWGSHLVWEKSFIKRKYR